MSAFVFSPRVLDTSTSLLRLVVAWPPPPELADYAAFKPLAGDAYGLVELSGTSSEAYAEVESACRSAFARRQTVGFSSVERPSAVFFDMDATVICEESLVELAAHAGFGPQVAMITERAMAGEIDFRTALDERVALLKGLPVSVIDEVAAGLTLMPGIAAFTALCRSLEVPTFLISGGFVQLASVVAAKAGFTAYHASTLGTYGGKLSGTVVGDVVDASAKLRYVSATCARLKLDLASVACVGDGANDGLMLGAAGVAVGHRAKEVLFPVLNALNESGDHRFLAPLFFGRACP